MVQNSPTAGNIARARADEPASARISDSTGQQRFPITSGVDARDWQGILETGRIDVKVVEHEEPTDKSTPENPAAKNHPLAIESMSRLAGRL